MAGAEAKFAMLMNKPNISKTGLKKATNDQSALLRAEKQTIQRISEINKLKPLIEQHAEKKEGVRERAREVEEKMRRLEQDLSIVKRQSESLRRTMVELKKTEAAQRKEYDAKLQERNKIRMKVDSRTPAILLLFLLLLLLLFPSSTSPRSPLFSPRL